MDAEGGSMGVEDDNPEDNPLTISSVGFLIFFFFEGVSLSPPLSELILEDKETEVVTEDEEEVNEEDEVLLPDEGGVSTVGAVGRFQPLGVLVLGKGTEELGTGTGLGGRIGNICEKCYFSVKPPPYQLHAVHHPHSPNRCFHLLVHVILRLCSFLSAIQYLLIDELSSLRAVLD